MRPETHLTDTDWLANVLADGEWHPLEQIILRSQRERGHGLTVHSRAADLRKRDGVTVSQRSERDGHRVRSFYRLSLEAPSLNPSREATGGAWDRDGSSSEPVSPASAAELPAGSLQLFEYSGRSTGQPTPGDGEGGLDNGRLATRAASESSPAALSRIGQDAA